MDTREKYNLAVSVAEEIIEVACEKGLCDKEGKGEDFDRKAIESWVSSHLDVLDLDSDYPENWLEMFLSDYKTISEENKVQVPSYWDKIKDMPKSERLKARQKEVDRIERITGENIAGTATTYLDIPILNLKKPVKVAPDVEAYYEVAVKYGNSYIGFENEFEAANWIKRNYLSLIYQQA